ncbi:hypothetical protein AN618_17490 [Fervidicola ferrireducens]|uniref:Polymerase nucleotidyl transferase domain-containing protein n=1 Tax=Fervidicola ferrireducens TaxID=520764 RepID=A0A140L5L4_9FIRM|nr:nucleotidyltransferase domain-containing protein [Fervidicola ferrireducens]KXG75839.1 hypothetical protein AN618_17490 [Fervidicola ferrireducens]
MPVRSSNSSVLKWPDKEAVVSSLLKWIEEVKQNRDDILKIGYFGSYARGDWGVGSDLDVIFVLKGSDVSFFKRSLNWDTDEIPVPVDLLVYTEEEYEEMKKANSKFYKELEKEAVWIYP